MTEPSKVRVLFTCTGVGVFNRGIESFFREAFDGLKKAADLEALLLKGAGAEGDRERAVPCLRRTGWAARVAGAAIGRNAYVAEQLSSFPSVARHIRSFKPQVIFYSDSNLGFQLHRWRAHIGVPFRLLFSNGGPCRPPFDRTDFVHQVAPPFVDEARQAGEPTEKHFLVPYGITMASAPSSDDKRHIRRQLALPENRPILLSVGWISKTHKRMHYLIDEAARLPEPRPFVMMLGATDSSSVEIEKLASDRLGHDGYSIRSVTYSEVADYYRAADLFALASLQEGFGRVFIEAMMHGLPVIAHRHPVIEYVTGGFATLRDLAKEGELSKAMAQSLAESPDSGSRHARWASVRDRFSWDVLTPEYTAMFRAVASR